MTHGEFPLHAHIARTVRMAPTHFFGQSTMVDVYQSRNMSKKVLTGQLVAVQVELRHGSAEPELRRDVACAERRYFFAGGTLKIYK